MVRADNSALLGLQRVIIISQTEWHISSDLEEIVKSNDEEKAAGSGEETTYTGLHFTEMAPFIQKLWPRSVHGFVRDEEPLSDETLNGNPYLTQANHGQVNFSYNRHREWNGKSFWKKCSVLGWTGSWEKALGLTRPAGSTTSTRTTPDCKLQFLRKRDLRVCELYGRCTNTHLADSVSTEGKVCLCFLNWRH